MSKTMGAFEAKTQFSSLIKYVKETHEKVFITLHGELVAEIIPINQSIQKKENSVSNTIEKLKKLSAQFLNPESSPPYLLTKFVYHPLVF
jgi:antitoxin (DNA-binding transcriptional repressor) of toxin-antitoxin stability system